MRALRQSRDCNAASSPRAVESREGWSEFCLLTRLTGAAEMVSMG